MQLENNNLALDSDALCQREREKKMRPRLVVVPATLIIIMNAVLWALFLPSPPPLNVPFTLPNLVNGIGLVSSVGLLISMFVRSPWLTRASGTLLIAMNLLLVRMAYLLNKTHGYESVAFLIAGIACLATISAAVVLFRSRGTAKRQSMA